MPIDGMITQACIDELSEVNQKKQNKAKWWVISAKVFVGKEKGCKHFKEAILQDFSTWSILGSFLASISFTGTILDEQITPHSKWNTHDLGWFLNVTSTSTSNSNLQNDELVIFETFIFFGLITLVMCFLEGNFFIQTLMFAVLFSVIRYAFSHISHQETLIHILSTLVFMHSFVSSLRGVICGLFKYLYFVPCPAEDIIEAVKIYIDDDMNSDCVENDWRTCLNWKSWILPKKYWDHMGPIIRGGISLCVGAFIMTWIKFGLVVAVPILFLASQFYVHVWDMKDKLWKSVWKYMKNLAPDQRNPDNETGLAGLPDGDDDDGRSRRSRSKKLSRKRASSRKSGTEK